MNRCFKKNVSKLFKKNGYVKKELVGRDLDVWFGGNDCEQNMEAMLKKDNVFYKHTKSAPYQPENLVMYMTPHLPSSYTKYVKIRGNLYDIKSDKNELKEVLGWTENKWYCEMLLGDKVIIISDVV